MPEFADDSRQIWVTETRNPPKGILNEYGDIF
jgi:hypothetical protein